MTEETKDTNVLRGPDFVDRYANNLRLESSVWDLKLVFGSVDQFAIPVALRQHTGVTIPWSEAKLVVYYMYLNILLHEVQNGKVTIAESVWPPDIEKVFEAEAGADENIRNVVERIKKLRDDLF